MSYDYATDTITLKFTKPALDILLDLLNHNLPNQDGYKVTFSLDKNMDCLVSTMEKVND